MEFPSVRKDIPISRHSLQVSGIRFPDTEQKCSLQNRVSVYPTQWILALTKADVFDERFFAQDFKYLSRRRQE